MTDNLCKCGHLVEQHSALGCCFTSLENGRATCNCSIPKETLDEISHLRMQLKIATTVLIRTENYVESVDIPNADYIARVIGVAFYKMGVYK